MSTEPSERSMERASDVANEILDHRNALDWHGQRRAIAAALDEAREEGHKTGLATRREEACAPHGRMLASIDRAVGEYRALADSLDEAVGLALASVREEGRREGLEEAAGIVDTEDYDGANLGKRALAQRLATEIRARSNPSEPAEGGS